jgi:hypothetical protein
MFTAKRCRFMTPIYLNIKTPYLAGDFSHKCSNMAVFARV